MIQLIKLIKLVATVCSVSTLMCSAALASTSKDVPVKLSAEPTDYDVDVSEELWFDMSYNDYTAYDHIVVYNNSPVGQVAVTRIKVVDNDVGWQLEPVHSAMYWKTLPLDTKQYALEFTKGKDYDLSKGSVRGKSIMVIDPEESAVLGFNAYMGGHTEDIYDENPADVVITLKYVS